MTTVATDGKSMAGDGQRECARTIVSTNAEKVLRLNDGRVFGWCGETGFGIALFDYLNGNTDKPDYQPEEGFAALILNLDGTLDAITPRNVLIRIEAPTAIGSGMDFAIGAMEHGASPEEAVAIACKRDPGTGGTVTALSVQ